MASMASAEKIFQRIDGITNRVAAHQVTQAVIEGIHHECIIGVPYQVIGAEGTAKAATGAVSQQALW